MTVRESDTYRRGLTLGLTMAEIFILILFLLLLVLLALYAVNFEQEKELQSATNDIEEIRIELREAKKELAAAVKKVNELEKNQLPEDIVHIVRKLQKENKHLADALDEANTLPEEPRERQAETENKNKSQQKIISNLRGQLAAAKGIDPPCWYKVTTRDGERHESPYYLMDVAVYNAHLQVRMRAAPPGYALDESKQKATTSYQEEYDKLPLPPSGTTKQVSLRQFATMTEPIKRMGKNKQIRDYACVFYAKVWDFTPACETVQETQRSSFLTPLAPLIRGELSGKSP